MNSNELLLLAIGKGALLSCYKVVFKTSINNNKVLVPSSDEKKWHEKLQKTTRGSVISNTAVN
jgi:hypothetical protein